MDADTEENVSKAEELTREVIEHLMPDAGVTFQATSQRAIEATLLKYGRLVQEAAAKEAEKPHTCNTQYATFERDQRDIVKAIREMPLP